MRSRASGAQWRETADRGEHGKDVVGPGPGGREPQVALSGAVGQAGRDVQQAVPQGFRFARVELVGQGEQSKPGDEVSREEV